MAFQWSNHLAWLCYPILHCSCTLIWSRKKYITVCSRRRENQPQNYDRTKQITKATGSQKIDGQVRAKWMCRRWFNFQWNYICHWSSSLSFIFFFPMPSFHLRCPTRLSHFYNRIAPHSVPDRGVFVVCGAVVLVSWAARPTIWYIDHKFIHDPSKGANVPVTFQPQRDTEFFLFEQINRREEKKNRFLSRIERQLLFVSGGFQISRIESMKQACGFVFRSYSLTTRPISLANNNNASSYKPTMFSKRKNSAEAI